MISPYRLAPEITPPPRLSVRDAIVIGCVMGLVGGVVAALLERFADLIAGLVVGLVGIAIVVTGGFS